MTYYDSFIAAWNAGGKPAGVAGASITAEMNTQQKLDVINGWTISGPQRPMVVESYRILDAIDINEYKALSAAERDILKLLLSVGKIDVSPNTQGRALLLDVFGTSNVTKSNFNNISNTFKPDIPWWKANGYRRPFDMGDVTEAGVI